MKYQKNELFSLTNKSNESNTAINFTDIYDFHKLYEILKNGDYPDFHANKSTIKYQAQDDADDYLSQRLMEINPEIKYRLVFLIKGASVIEVKHEIEFSEEDKNQAELLMNEMRDFIENKFLFVIDCLLNPKCKDVFGKAYQGLRLKQAIEEALA